MRSGSVCGDRPVPGVLSPRLIASKWEAPYQAQGVELVDVTMPIVRLFKPTEQTLKIIEQMKGTAPIPFSKLPLDPMM